MKRQEALEYARQKSIDTGDEWGVYADAGAYFPAPVQRTLGRTDWLERFRGGNPTSGAAYAGKVPSPGRMMPRA